MIWTFHYPHMGLEALGFIPDFFSEADPRSAREQINSNYAHGGGWQPLPGCTLTENSMIYPGDPPFRLLASTKLRDETIRFYAHSFMSITQTDGSYEVARVD